MILALETAGPTSQFWLFEAGAQPGQEPLAHAVWESGRSLADELLGRLQALLADKQASWPDVTGLIIFSGPGSFTSLRIGHAVVNTLALDLGLPAVGTRGDDWLAEGLKQLSKTPLGSSLQPFYGAEANITRPKA